LVLLLLLLLPRRAVCKQHVQQQVRMQVLVLLVSVLLCQALLLWSQLQM
jgi:hypothetical protein